MKIKASLLKIIIILSISVICLLILIIYPFNNENSNYDSENGIISRPLKNLEKANGIVTNIWLDGTKIDNLKNHEIKYLFVDIGDTGQDGKIKTPEEDIEKFIHLISEYEKEKNYDFIIIPYSEVYTYDYDITSVSFQENFIEDYKNFISLGFDGVYVDIEPIRKGQEEDYLIFLEDLNKEISQDKIIGAYSGAVSNSKLSINEWEWDLDFYEKVANRIDLIFVPGYDSFLTDKGKYQNNIKNQIDQLSSRTFNSQFMLGIPTHKPSPETIENALEAYQDGINQNPKNQFIGVGVFAEWTTHENEWGVYENYLG